MSHSLPLIVASAVALCSVVSTAAAQTGKPSAAPKTWKCSAAGLVNASYDGGDGAYVHLTGFSSGGTYPVTKNKAGTTATGTTANGTKFTCTAS